MAVDFPDLGLWPSGGGTGGVSDVYELVGQIGAEVALPLDSALERVQLLAASGRIGKRSLRAMGEEIARARRVALTGQQIARLARDGVQQSARRIDLPQTLRDLLERRGAEIAARGLEVRQVFKPGFAQVDGALLAMLLNSLLDWAFEHCCDRTVHVVTDLRNWPVRVQLLCEFAWRPADDVDTEGRPPSGVDTRQLNSVDWRLIERLAHTMGVGVERSDSPWQARALFEFEQAPSAVVPPLTEPAHAGDALASGPDAAPLFGHHVLVVSPRREVRNQVREALRPMGLMVDYVTSVEEAREFCAGGLPNGLIFDEALPAFESLRLELLAENPRLAMLQISDDVGALHISLAGTQPVARVSVNAIVESLPGALAYELARLG